MMLDILAVILVATLAIMGWQHRRYQRIRRDLAQDRQRLMHSRDVFHVIVFFQLRSGNKVIETARRFEQQVLSFSKVRLIYAGQSAFTESAQQMGNREFDGVLLFEFPSRADYEQARTDPRMVVARQSFGDSYFHGMRRNRNASTVLPQLLLRRRLKDLLTGKWRMEPLQSSLEFETSPSFEVWRARVSRLQALQQVNRRGLVIFHLVKYGPGGYQRSVDGYGNKLQSRMAALGYGPLHIGRSIALEEFARFNRVYIVYYPSAHYFADLLGSQYFHSLAGQRYLGDSIMVATVPITARVLRGAVTDADAKL